MNLTNSIAGRMAGVVAVNRSGEPGYDGAGIRIRGSNTLGNNDALIVIDGIPARAGGIDRLNPNDIETISVLKDATTVEDKYQLESRDFTSFIQASEEASISRLYGGIHFMDAIVEGQEQGRQVGTWVIQTLEKSGLAKPLSLAHSKTMN